MSDQRVMTSDHNVLVEQANVAWLVDFGSLEYPKVLQQKVEPLKNCTKCWTIVEAAEKTVVSHNILLHWTVIVAVEVVVEPTAAKARVPQGVVPQVPRAVADS